jgi:hypothetical protein
MFKYQVSLTFCYVFDVSFVAKAPKLEVSRIEEGRCASKFFFSE